MSEENTSCSSNGCADAKAVTSLVVIFVMIMCFFLTGGGQPTLIPVFMIGAAVLVLLVLWGLFASANKGK